MFRSILYPPGREELPAWREAPPFFTDVGLKAILERLAPYCSDLTPFLAPTQDRETIRYRQEIGRDLENIQLRTRFARLSRGLIAMEKQLSAKETQDLPYLYGCRLVILAQKYMELLQNFLEDLPYREIRSQGLRDFVLHIRACLHRSQVAEMRMEILSLQRQWQKLETTLVLSGNQIFLGESGGGSSLEEDIRRQFCAFRENGAALPCDQPPAGETDPRSENGILTLLAHRFPALFQQLHQFVQENRAFADPDLLRAASQLPFYLSWLDETDRLSRYGCRFCYPELLSQWEGCRVENCFDMALAQKLWETGGTPVTNSLQLNAGEHILVITGPNQGGKTTYTRMLGQLFYLTSLGLRVPGSSGAIRPIDRVFTHFLRLGDKGAVGLRADLLRLREITSQATGDSLVLVNEIFASAPHGDGLDLGGKMLRMLDRIGCLTVCVTFLTELAEFSPAAVSLCSQVEDGETRTYRLERSRPDGNAHALSLAHSKGLTYETIRERVGK